MYVSRGVFPSHMLPPVYTHAMPSFAEYRETVKTLPFKSHQWEATDYWNEIPQKKGLANDGHRLFRRKPVSQ
jgi:hypothetical protein